MRAKPALAMKAVAMSFFMMASSPRFEMGERKLSRCGSWNPPW
jgi:hypothetical protein